MRNSHLWPRRTVRSEETRPQPVFPCWKFKRQPKEGDWRRSSWSVRWEIYTLATEKEENEQGKKAWRIEKCGKLIPWKAVSIATFKPPAKNPSVKPLIPKGSGNTNHEHQFYRYKHWYCNLQLTNDKQSLGRVQLDLIGEGERKKEEIRNRMQNEQMTAGWLMWVGLGLGWKLIGWE